MLLVGSARLGTIIGLEKDLQFKQSQLQHELGDLQTYSDNLSDGVTIDNLSTCPPSMFGRSCIFQAFSNEGSLKAASADMQYMQQSGMLNGAMAQIAQQSQNNAAQQKNAYMKYVFANLYQQERTKFVEKEKKNLNQKEKKIQKQIDEINIQLKMLDAEKEPLKTEVEKEAKEAAPRFGS